MKRIVNLLVVGVFVSLATIGPSSAAEDEADAPSPSDMRSGTIFHVDVASGDDHHDGLTHEKALATIQKGIDLAKDGDTVLVWPGAYTQAISFKGKAITVTSAAEPAMLEAPGDFAVSFAGGEGPNSVLRNFIIRNSRMAAFIAAASPTLTNLTVVANEHGIGAYGRCQPNISNSIFWNNAKGDLFQCQARYSCFAGAGDGEGNIHLDPQFADPNLHDYHLRSERGRYWPKHKIWVLDKVTSPCVDAGDPSADCANEHEPNGGRINMGAYGGTAYASLSEPAMAGDVGRPDAPDRTDVVTEAKD